jgi:hypothetical protein
MVEDATKLNNKKQPVPAKRGQAAFAHKKTGETPVKLQIMD